MPQRLSIFIKCLICILYIPALIQAEVDDHEPLWNLAWITDTQTAECEWITMLLNRVQVNKPKMAVHTGDTRFEWANRCAWQDVVDLLRVETPPIEFHLAPGNHDLLHGVLKLHLRKAAAQGIYRLDTGSKAKGYGYYHNRVPEEVSGILWPVWNPEVVDHPAWQRSANQQPAHWQHPELPYRYVFKRGGIRFIVCDTFYTEEQKQWLRDILVQPDDSSVSIVLHHKHEVEDLAKYFEGLEGRHNVKLVLTGDHHKYCYEERGGITYITAAGIARGHEGNCDAMTLWVYPDQLQLDRYVIPKGLPIQPIQGPKTIWACSGKFSPYERPAFPAQKVLAGKSQEPIFTQGTNLIQNGDFDNGIWYERYRGWSPSYWYQWFTRGGHAPEHAVGKRLPHSSKEYVRIHMWARAWRGGILQNIRNVEPCHMYRLTAYGFFQPEGSPQPRARIGINPCGSLARQFSVDVSKHPAPKYDEGVGDDPKTKEKDGLDIDENTIWSDYHDYYRCGKFEVTAEAKSDVITAILYCAPEQRSAEKPIYEMNWDSVTLQEIPWPYRRLVDEDAIMTPYPRLKKIIVTQQPEFDTVQVTWKTDIPTGASQILYRFPKAKVEENTKEISSLRSGDFPFETPVIYEKSARYHRVEIKDPAWKTADVLELVALSRSLVKDQCVTICSEVIRVSPCK